LGLMELPVMARKWVHDASLMHMNQPKAPAVALKDKKYGRGTAPKLGREGERRFAPRLGKAGEMQEIQPGTFSNLLFCQRAHQCQLNFVAFCAAAHGERWMHVNSSFASFRGKLL
jgi:hypothetical protein